MPAASLQSPGMRRVLSLFIVAVVAGCSTAPEVVTTTTTAPDTSPDQVVADWIGAVAAGDYAATEPLVDEVSLALMIGAENPMEVADLADMVVDGVGPTARATYWETFRSDFAVFAGVSFDRLRVAAAEALTVDGTEFAAVEVTAGDLTSEILCRRGSDGAWRVDMVATFGPQLVRALRTLVVTLPPGDDGEAVRAAFLGQVAGSLRAGLERAPGGDLPDAFRIELEALVGYLESGG